MDGTRRLRIVVARWGAGIVGGAERHARMLALALRDRGWEVEVLTTCATDERTWANALPPGRETGGGIAVERFPVAVQRFHHAFRQLSRGFWRLPPRLRPERAWLLLQGPFAPALHTALRRRPVPCTLFVTYLYRTTVAGVHDAAGTRLLLPTAHDEPPLRLRAVGRALAAVDGILYATPEERALVEGVHPRAARRPAEVGNVAVEVPAGVDPDRFRSRFDLGGPYLLYGGRATDGKGVGELLEGAARLRATHPGVTLVLTGEAGERTPSGAGVLAVGTLADPLRWDALAGAAAIVVPSFYESLSLLALEGWAAGRPALLNGASPVLRGQAERSGGALVYRGPAELAEAAARLLDDPALADRLGDAGRRFMAETATWDAVVARLERLMDGAGAAGR